MSTTSKVIIGIAGAAAVAGAGWVAFGTRERAAAPFLTATVDRGTIIQSVATTGSLQAVTTVKVGSQVSGIIASLHADFNDRVSKDQILATLDPTPFEAQVAETKAQLDRAQVGALDARIKYRRQLALFDASLSSEDDRDSAKAVYDQAEAQVTQLRATLERAETNLRYSIIRSPIDGVVVSRDYDVGQTVAASFQAPTLFTIAEDLRRMQLTCNVDEADIGQVRVGQPVRFSVDTFPDREFTGKVAQIRLSPTVANNVVTYPVIVEVANQDLTLLPGMTADVRIHVAEVTNALRVPSAALRFRPELLGLSGQVAHPANGARDATGAGRPGSDRAGAGNPARGGRNGAAHGGGTSEPGPGTEGRVFLAPGEAGGKLRTVTFVSGLTDGQYVEVKSGELAEGEKIVVGVATAQSQDVGGLAAFGRRH